MIDNYQRVTSAANDLALLRTVTVNPQLYLVVAARRYNVLDTPVAAMRVDTSLVTRADLALTDREVAQLGRTLSTSIDGSAASRFLTGAQVDGSSSLPWLLGEADGWPLAVRTDILGDGGAQFARGLYRLFIFGAARTMAGLLAHVAWVRATLLQLSADVFLVVATESPTP